MAKRAKIQLSQEMLRSLLYLPDDAFIFGAMYDPERTVVEIFFTADDLPETGEAMGSDTFDYVLFYTKEVDDGI